MIFVNRKYELDILRNKLDNFILWKWLNTSHVAFLWLRRIWKTFLVKYFLDNIDTKKLDVCRVFVDVSKTKDNIYNFCNDVLIEYAKSVNNSFFDVDLDLFFHEFFDWKFYSFYKTFLNKTDNYEIFTSFLKLLTLLSKEKKVIIVFDEFQDILEFKKLNGLKNIDDIFRSELQNQYNVFYIITWSYPTILRDLIQNPKKKLYSHFDIYDIKNFNKESSLDLIKTYNKNLSREKSVALFRSCNWNPYLLSLILQKIDLSLLGTFEENLSSLLFDQKWAIYTHYEYILEESLSKIQNNIFLKSVLKEISFSLNWLTLNELSKKIHIQPQQVLFWLKQLSKIDLIFQTKEKTWKFQDLLFSNFISYSYGGIEKYEYVKNDFYYEQVKILQENLNKALTELWKTKEFELYYEVKQNQWKMWKWIKLPKFKIIKKNYYTEIWDEIDLYCETYRWKKWIFELKYRKKQIWNKQIESFVSKMNVSRYVFISKSGFTKNTNLSYLNNKNIFLIDLWK